MRVVSGRRQAVPDRRIDDLDGIVFSDQVRSRLNLEIAAARIVCLI
jgi:hypothetical protein